MASTRSFWIWEVEQSKIKSQWKRFIHANTRWSHYSSSDEQWFAGMFAGWLTNPTVFTLPILPSPPILPVNKKLEGSLPFKINWKKSTSSNLCYFFYREIRHSKCRRLQLTTQFYCTHSSIPKDLFIGIMNADKYLIPCNVTVQMHLLSSLPFPSQDYNLALLVPCQDRNLPI